MKNTNTLRETVQATVYIDEKIYEKVRKIAFDERISVSAVLRNVIKEKFSSKPAPPKPSAKLKGLLSPKPKTPDKQVDTGSNPKFLLMKNWLKKHPEQELEWIAQQRVWAQKLDHIRIPEDLNKVTEFYYPVFEHFMVENHPEITSEILGGGK